VTQEKEEFLQRWSRLKREQAAAPAEAKPAPVAAAQPEPAQPLPPVEKLTPESDFAPFMNPKVDPATRRSALRKLFADTHFNVPDPFEAYSEDYTKGDPIPEAMLKAINEIRDAALRPPEEKAVAEGEAAQPQARSAEAPQGETKDVAGRQDA